jgi:hypothetical protein
MSLVLVLGLLLDLNYGKTFTSLKKWALKRVRRKVIYRGDGKPYLIRYTPFTCKAFSIKIHNILLSDPSCQHDHPWSFLTVILKGGYIEHTPTGSKYHSAGTTLYRPAEFAHRLEVDKPVWSFVITFKKVRKWGFFTKKGWVIWYKYQPENTCE